MFFKCKKKCSLFCFCSLVCVLCFLCVWNLLVKKKRKIKRFKIALITSFILLLMTGVDIFYALFCIILFCFAHYKNDSPYTNIHAVNIISISLFVCYFFWPVCLFILFFNFLEVVCLFIFLVQGFLFIYVSPSWANTLLI